MASDFREKFRPSSDMDYFGPSEARRKAEKGMFQQRKRGGRKQKEGKGTRDGVKSNGINARSGARNG